MAPVSLWGSYGSMDVKSVGSGIGSLKPYDFLGLIQDLHSVDEEELESSVESRCYDSWSTLLPAMSGVRKWQ